MRPLLLALILVFSWSCQEKKSVPPEKELSGPVFGSTYSIKYLGDLEKEDFSQELGRFFKDFNQEFSTYQEDSTISVFNQSAAGKKIKVTPRFIEMLKLVRVLHENTQGAFDPTIGPLIRAWGFYKGKPARPSQAEIVKARASVGMEHLHFDEKNLEVRKSRSGLTLDLNAFAPGWAADLIGAELLKKDILNFMVDIGGEILVKGKKSSGSWVIGIEKPSDKLTHELQIAVRISDRSISTSGDYRQFFLESGERRSHILDPRTGMPVNHAISSVTTIAGSAVEADAWGTALMVLGQEGMELAEKNNVSALFLKAEEPGKFHSIMSPGMESYLEANQL